MLRKPLILISAVKSFLPFQSGYTAEDQKLAQLIELATQQIEEFTRRSFTRQTHEEIFSTKNTRRVEYAFSGDDDSGVVLTSSDQIFTLRGWPMTATAVSVYYDTTGAFAAETLIDPVNYKIDRERGRIILRYPTTQNYQSLKVVYEAGFEIENNALQGSASADLKQACVLQTMFLWTRSKPGNIGVADDREQGATPTSAFRSQQGLDPEAASLVAKYRIIGKGNA